MSASAAWSQLGTILRPAPDGQAFRLLFGFRNATAKLRPARASAARHAIGMSYGWDCQSVDQKKGCGDDQKNTFHGCFLLVLENRTVILSCREVLLKDHFSRVACSEFVTRLATRIVLR